MTKHAGSLRRTAPTLAVALGLVAVSGRPVNGQAPDPAHVAGAFDFLVGDWTTTGRLASDRGAEPGLGTMSVTRIFADTGVPGVRIVKRQAPAAASGGGDRGRATYEAERLFVGDVVRSVEEEAGS